MVGRRLRGDAGVAVDIFLEVETAIRPTGVPVDFECARSEVETGDLHFAWKNPNDASQPEWILYAVLPPNIYLITRG